MRLLPLFVCLAAYPCLADAPHACVGSQSLATFKLLAVPAKGGRTIALRDANTLPTGTTLLYEPVHIPTAVKDKAEIAVLLGPARNSQAPIEALKPEPAGKSTMWTLPRDASVVALVYGPQGLSMRKVKSLMQRNDEMLTELADYADESSQVAALIEALHSSENSASGMSAALAGFSAKSGVAMPVLDPRTTASQQAVTLLHALQPAMNSMDPLTASDTAVMQQSTGLAAAVAGLFFGNSVTLLAGGASLFQNMRTMLFPETEFRSTIAQTAVQDALCLCAKNQTAKSRTRVAYLWARRLPELPEPKFSLAATAHLPLASKEQVAVHADRGAKDIARLRDWQLVSAKGNESFHVPVTAAKEGTEVQLDLSKVKATPGLYHLKAYWDWDNLPIAGDLYLHPLGDLKQARLAAGSGDKLVEGNGRIPLKLEGTDFEFVDKVMLEKQGPHATPVSLAFDLPRGKRGGDQQSIDAEVDTNGLAPGTYNLVLAQSGSEPHPIHVTLLPPNPKITDLPLRTNLEEPSQQLELTGTGLDRIEKIGTDAGDLDLAPSPSQAGTRDAVFHLKAKTHQGERFDLRLKVQGLEAPVLVASAIEIEGPRPRIASVRRSNAQSLGLELDRDEIASSSIASFAISVGHAGSEPAVEVTCADAGTLRQKLRLAAGDRGAGGRLDLAGEGVLFLSLDPGEIGRSGCRLQAHVISPDGASDAYPLGRILRVPRIEQFVMTDQKLDDGLYAGTLRGEDLDTIEQTGWDAEHGTPVSAIPDAIAGESQKQILKVELPWPAPAPHAPVFVWLRGEAKGRATGVKY